MPACPQSTKLLHPPLLGASILKPHLYDPHVEAGLLRQLLPDVPSGFGGGREGRLEGLQLLGLDGGAGPPPLGPQVLVVVLVASGLLVRDVGALRVLGVV